MLPNVMSGCPSFITKPAMICMEGPLAGRHHVRALRIVRRIQKPLLCRTKPVRGRGDAAAVDGKHAMNQRDHVAPSIGGREIDRAALGAAGDARLRRLRPD